MGTLDRQEKQKREGKIPNSEKPNRSRYSKKKYQFMLNAPFEIGNRCCNVMKKEPAHRYAKESGKKPITAQMADESQLRTQQWLKEGCNAFDNNNPISNPMSFWTEQDVLKYIKEYNIEICSVYGNVIIDNGDEVNGQMGMFDANDSQHLCTTGCERTGCVFCLFGCHLEKNPNRLEKLKLSHPQLYDYVMRDEKDGGLGYKWKIDWINENNGKGTMIKY